jgi:hypothetical protein
MESRINSKQKVVRCDSLSHPMKSKSPLVLALFHFTADVHVFTWIVPQVPVAGLHQNTAAYPRFSLKSATATFLAHDAGQFGMIDQLKFS